MAVFLLESEHAAKKACVFRTQYFFHPCKRKTVAGWPFPGSRIVRERRGPDSSEVFFNLYSLASEVSRRGSAGSSTNYFLAGESDL